MEKDTCTVSFKYYLRMLETKEIPVSG